ncbi:MAG: methylenetetrahydrofolate reductase, partial [Notoacmeibacter sp.]
QYCYDVPLFKEFMKRVRDMGLDEQCFILVGVGPLASAKTARWMASNVPGVHIPESVIKRIEGAADQKAEGKKLCIDIISECKEIAGVHGVHVMAYRQEEFVAEIVHESGILKGRKPWTREKRQDEQQISDRMNALQGRGAISPAAMAEKAAENV